jgi:hypothetical protein
MTRQIEFKHTFPLDFWCILLWYLNIENLQVHCKATYVGNGEYSIIHLLSPTCTSLDILKNRGKKYSYLKIYI